jgi:hypothetical protein
VYASATFHPELETGVDSEGALGSADADVNEVTDPGDVVATIKLPQLQIMQK